MRHTFNIHIRCLSFFCIDNMNIMAFFFMPQILFHLISIKNNN